MGCCSEIIVNLRLIALEDSFPDETRIIRPSTERKEVDWTCTTI